MTIVEANVPTTVESEDDIIDLRQVAIEAIMRETDCRRKHAQGTMVLIESWLNAARKSGAVHFMSTSHLRSRQYHIFEAVVPHGTIAEPGSAHAAIEDALLDPARSEFGLIHEEREEGGDYYCAVSICLSVVMLDD